MGGVYENDVIGGPVIQAKLQKRANTREENKTRNENNTKEKKRVHSATHDATQARPTSSLFVLFCFSCNMGISCETYSYFENLNQLRSSTEIKT